MTECSLASLTDYQQFLASKAITVAPVGFTPTSPTAPLFDFQSDIVRIALLSGRFCIWADCGMGKTPMQLEWASQVCEETGGRVLILAPLAVSHQTVREAQKFGIHGVEYAADGSNTDARIVVTNYQKLHHFNPAEFVGVVIDESSILKSMDGKTRTAIIDAFALTPYRLACSATPAPNDYMELGNHAEFLGIMTRVEMLSMFFVHDGGDTSKWRLKGHAQAAFWEWVCTWAATLRKPSDLGYEDGAFVLPTLRLVDHIVETPREQIADERGQVGLFAMQAQTLGDQRQVQRASLELRVAEAVSLANSNDEQWIVWCHLNDESAALSASIRGAVEVAGSDTDEHKESAMLRFQRGEIRVLVSKASICGFGMNFQNCHNVAFVGLSHSYEAFYQAIRRCWRFGQTQPVAAHIIYDWAEGAVIENTRRKEQEATEMAEQMAGVMRQKTIERLHQVQRQTAPYVTDRAEGAGWQAYLGDCVDGVARLDADSIHYSIFSPPFASLYTYSNSDRDMGNCKTHGDFSRHFQFLVRELHRVLMPGRLVSFHCMNLPLSLGLLHKQLVKDSCMSRQGIPDYLVTMRKPGENPERVSGPLEDYAGDDPAMSAVKSGTVRDSINIWQRYASPVWMDIDMGDTLQYRSARDNEDERHICPLQLGVIRRGVQLWTNPGDLVLDPFMGIASTGHVALEMDRAFVGFELKPSYFACAVTNLRETETQVRQASVGLFDEATA